MFSGRIFIFCNGSGHVVVLDAKNDEILKTLALGGAPEFSVVDGKGSIFNNLEDSNEIVELDTKTLAIKNRFSLNTNETPTGLAIDVANNLLFSVCRKSKTMVVMNAKNGNIVSTLPIGEGGDGVTFDITKKLIVVSNADATATVVHQDSPDKYTVVQTLTTDRRQRTITHSPTTHNIYMSGATYEADGKTVVPNSFGVYVYGIK